MVQTKDRYTHTVSATNDIRLPPWKSLEHHKQQVLCQGVLLRTQMMVYYTKQFSSFLRASLRNRIPQDIQMYTTDIAQVFQILEGKESKNIPTNKQCKWHLYLALKWKQKDTYICMVGLKNSYFQLITRPLYTGRLSKQAFFPMTIKHRAKQGSGLYLQIRWRGATKN